MWSAQTTEVREVVEQMMPTLGRLARGLMRRYSAHGHGRIEHSDLVDAGCVGVLEAVARGASMESDGAYVRVVARSRMLDELRRQDPLNVGQRRRVRALGASEQELCSRLQRRPTEAELAAWLGVSESQVDELRTLAAAGCHAELPEELAAGASWDPGAVLEAQQVFGRLESALSRLGVRERGVIIAYYLEGVPLTDVASRLGVTVGRASQIKASALTALRAALECGGTQRGDYLGEVGECTLS